MMAADEQAPEREILLRDDHGFPILWLERWRDGRVTLNDYTTSAPFDPEHEDVAEAVRLWLEATK